jgi:hypothetical protein
MAANIAKRSADIAEKTVQTMQDTAQRELRAYVFVTDLSFDFESTEPVAVVRFENRGKTPAYDCVHTYMTEFREYPLLSPLPEPVNRFVGRGSLAPGDGRTSYNRAVRAFTHEENNTLRSGTRAIYVYGHIQYKDVFGHERVTKHRGMQGGVAGVRDRQMVVAEEGNEAT